MRKVLLAGVLAAMLLCTPALAEIYEGTVIAASSIPVVASSGGILDRFDVTLGSIIEQGDILGAVRTTRVFATQDGTVARIHVDEEEEVDGAVLEIYPIEQYQVYCTVDDAYQEPSSMLIHPNEYVYMKCTANGTHRGIGMITQIEGEEYRVLALGGEFYVGETVYIYRDEDFSSAERVGVGTVVTMDTEIYESTGTVIRYHVSEGEYVERGELLYEYAESSDVDIIAPEGGIVADISVSPGDCLAKEQTVLTLVPCDALCIEIEVDETLAAQLSTDDIAVITYAFDPLEQQIAGKVKSVRAIPESTGYFVEIIPENMNGLKLGLSATVRFIDKEH